jgi:hypothetical protein
MSANGANERLAELGLELPEPSAPGANYVPFVRTADLVSVTGQLSQWNGERCLSGSSDASSTSRMDNAQPGSVR